jgi:hypothetical protein
MHLKSFKMYIKYIKKCKFFWLFLSQKLLSILPIKILIKYIIFKNIKNY